MAFTNASQVNNLIAMAAELGRAGEMRANLNRVRIASIGAVYTAALTKHGVAIGLESDPPKLGAPLSTLERVLSG